jgi:hypothetical protein
MIRFVFAIALLLMGLTPSVAQNYCEQVRQGIAQYGFRSAMNYALEHYTADEVKAIDACVVKLGLRRQASTAGRAHQHHRGQGSTSSGLSIAPR